MKERWSSFFPPIKKNLKRSCTPSTYRVLDSHLRVIDLAGKWRPSRIPEPPEMLSNETWWVVLFQQHCWLTLFEKSNFCPKIQFWQNFTIFSGNQSFQQLKYKTPTFSRVFHQFFFWQFYREIKVEFLDKKWRFSRGRLRESREKRLR